MPKKQKSKRAVLKKQSESPLSEQERLALGLKKLGHYNGWVFSYEYPGLFCYSNSGYPLRVYFTPDWDRAGTASIQVQDAEGNVYDEYSKDIPFSPIGRTAHKLFMLVKPTIDALMRRWPPGMRVK